MKPTLGVKNWKNCVQGTSPSCLAYEYIGFVMNLRCKNKFKLFVRGFATLLVACLLAMSACSVVFASVQDDAKKDIAKANAIFIESYSAVSAAQKAGANVTSLTNVLNAAGLWLSDAELNYAQGNYATAETQALYSQEQITGVMSVANSLADSASQAGYQSFLINIVGSLVGAVAVVLAALGIWILLKKKQEKAGKTT